MFFLEFFVNYSQSGDCLQDVVEKMAIIPGKKKIRQNLARNKILTTHRYFSLYFFMATNTENQIKKCSDFYEFFSLTCGGGFQAWKIISFFKFF
jgi:hypothetical protein